MSFRNIRRYEGKKVQTDFGFYIKVRVFSNPYCRILYRILWLCQKWTDACVVFCFVLFVLFFAEISSGDNLAVYTIL